ncbi:MAG: DEAD/DEAH box helicase family protein [Candidatus Solibacter sp.]
MGIPFPEDRPDVRDERYAGTAIEAKFHGQLRPFQEEAIAKITELDEGISCAPTAFGKTAVTAWMIAKRTVNTQIVVHRQQLLDQLQEHLRMFLNLPATGSNTLGTLTDGPAAVRKPRTLQPPRHPNAFTQALTFAGLADWDRTLEALDRLAPSARCG